MSSNSFTWVTKGGDLDIADWDCLAGRCASLCLQAAHMAVRQAALVSDESALEACLRRCAIQIDDLYLVHNGSKTNHIHHNSSNQLQYFRNMHQH